MNTCNVSGYIRFLKLSLLAYLSLSSPAFAQTLEECARYAPSTLEGWIGSDDLKLAAYGYTCRMINLDRTLDQARREDTQAEDVYPRMLQRIREASALNRRWAGAEATRNLAVLARLEVKYRRLAER